MSKHLDRFISEYKIGNNLQVEIIKYINRHQLGEDDALRLIDNIKNLGEGDAP